MSIQEHVLLVQEVVFLWKTSTLVYHNSAGFASFRNSDSSVDDEEEESEEEEEEQAPPAPGPFFFI